MNRYLLFLCQDASSVEVVSYGYLFWDVTFRTSRPRQPYLQNGKPSKSSLQVPLSPSNEHPTSLEKLSATLTHPTNESTAFVTKRTSPN
jgi:hypothetical protein